MKKICLKTILAVSGLTILAVGVAIDSNIFDFSNLSLRLSHALRSPGSITLDSSNSPTLSGGAANKVDSKGVTWDYSNCASYASGHVSLNNSGYFCVSTTTAYAYTGISKITVSFTSLGNSNELWLLKSVNGVNWSEDHILTSGEEVTSANNWRYVKFYNYSPDDTAINITSVTIDYSCSGIGAYEDVDNALYSNVSSTSDNLTTVPEYNTLSPSGDSTEAISFTKSDKSSSWCFINFNSQYLVGDIANKTLEFDYYKEEFYTNNGNPITPSVQFFDNQNKTFGLAQNYEAGKTAYTYSHIEGNWYHIRVPISSMISTMTGYKMWNEEKQTWYWQDNPIETNKIAAGVKIGNGTSIIDNLRIDCTPVELGIYNNGNTVDTSDPKPYWLKLSWSGLFHNVTYVITPSSAAMQNPADDPKLKTTNNFYIRGLDATAEQFTVDVTMVVGYNHRTCTKQVTLNIQ